MSSLKSTKDSLLERGKGLFNKGEKGKGLINKGKGLVASLFGKSTADSVGTSINSVKKGGLISGFLGSGSKAASDIGKSMKGGVMSGFFGKAGNLAKMGLGTGKSLLKKLPFIGAVAGAGFAIAALAQGNIGGAIKEVASGLAGAIPVIGPALSFAVDFFGDSIIGGAIGIGKKAWEGAQWLGNKIWEGASALGGMLVEGGKALWEGAKWVGNKAWEGAEWLGGKLYDGAAWLMGWETDAKAEAAAVEGANKAVTQATEGATVTSPVATVATTASPVGMNNDVASAIKQEQAQSQPPSSEIMSPELNKIASESTTQTEKLDQLVALMREIVNQNKQGSDINVGQSATNTNTSINKVQQKPPNYFRVPTGMVNQLSTRNAANIGLPNV